MSTTSPATRKRCHLAWHITSRCNLACPHCLRRTPGRAMDDLPAEACRAILASFLAFARETGREAEVEFSGGNPLLREDFPEFLAAAGAAKATGLVRNIRILGNPETLDNAMVRRVRDAGVDDFVISLDGLAPANDRMRGAGSFRAGLRGIRALVANGVPTSVKFTLVRENADQVPHVLRICVEEGVRHLGVGPLILAGGGWEQRDHALTPLEYRQWLLDMLAFFDGADARYEPFRRAFLANRLYALLFHELGRQDEYRALAPTRQGPFGVPGGSGANTLFVVWSDGEVVVRRGMPRVGWAPRDSFREIYEHAPLLRLLEDGASIRALAQAEQANNVKCRVCPVRDLCQPMLAGWFDSRPLFATNRLCWR
jgi:MoaA/NifB/PqqE/SkfB family radical SAM enzyme